MRRLLIVVIGRVRGRFLEAANGGRPVRRLLLFKATLLMVACVVAASSGCGLFHPRQGTIVRGNWSLECTRVPWSSGTQTCTEVGGAGCDQGMMVEPSAVSGCPVGCPTRFAGVGPLACRTCARPGPTASVSQAPPPMGHSRFHPVPTRPVFTPWNCPVSTARAQAQPLPVQPRQPEREVIPTPAGSLSQMEPTGAARPVTSAAWIFRPEEDEPGQRVASR